MSSDDRAVSQVGPGMLPFSGDDLLERKAAGETLEAALASDQGGMVALYGAAGMGKTSLVVQVAERLLASEQFGRVVYTSFAGGGLAELALVDLADQLLGKRRQRKTVAESRLMEALAQKPTLICWDDLDTVTGEGPMGLSEVMKQELFGLAQRLGAVSGTRLLLVCSRPPAHPLLAQDALNQVALEPLSAEEADELWARWKEPEEGTGARLAGLLGGNPMALGLAGELVRVQGLDAAEQTLEAVLPGFRYGEGKQRNQGLFAAMEAWIRGRPGPQAEAVAAMGVFSCGFVANLPARLAQIPDDTWAALLGAMIRSRVARTAPIVGLKVPYVHVHAAFLEHVSRRMDLNQAKILRGQYVGNYLGLQAWMVKNRERAAEAVASLRWLELPNLRRVLPMLVTTGEVRFAREYSQRMADLLEDEGLYQEAGLVRDAVGRAVSDLLSRDRPLSQAEVRMLLDQADSLVEGRRHGEAGAMLQRLCDRFGQEKGLGYSGEAATLDHAKACRRLGSALVALRQGDLAMAPLVQAEQLLAKVQGADGAGGEILELALALAPLYMAQNQAEKAHGLWKRALPLAEAAKRGEDVARIRQQLAAGALRAQDAELAEEHLQAAIEALQDAEDTSELQATLRDQLAAVALQMGSRDRAIDSLEQAVALQRADENRPAEATDLVRLASLLKAEGQFQEAEAHLARAAALYQEGGQRSALAVVEIETAQLLLDAGRAAEAQVHAEAARAILADGKVPGPLWRAYELLRDLARADADPDEADKWQAAAVEAFARSSAARTLLTRWAPLLNGLVAASRGDALQGDLVVALEEMEQDATWRDTVAAFWRVLGGERGDDLYLSLDVNQAVVVKALLAAVEAPVPEEPESPPEETPQSPTPQVAPGPVGGMPREVQATVRRVFTTVLQAVRGDADARFVAGMLLQTLQQKGQAEPMVQYARAMARILAGERDPSLAQGLIQELAEPVQALLKALSQDGKPSG